MKLNVLRADPAGNITLFVLDPVERPRRAALAAALMRLLPEWGIEQVGFACPPAPGTDGRMEMMGGEFCGNATRAYAMYLSRRLGGAREIRLSVSGCGHAVTARVDPERGTAYAEMPVPRGVRRVEAGGLRGTLVDLGGIVHFVTSAAEPGEAVFHAVEPIFSAAGDADAYGVIFLDRDSHRMTPLVKVVQTGTLVWEGSCGSGSVACAAAESEGVRDGVYAQDYIQPSGVVSASVTRRDGRIIAAEIGGVVSLGEPTEIDLPDGAAEAF